jgi:hypothetical protein
VVTEYRDISLQKLVDLAETSSEELGATGGNWVVNYETGKPFEAPDYDTALFLASAREIVLELAYRIKIHKLFIEKVAHYEYHDAELGLLALQDYAIDLLKAINE